MNELQRETFQYSAPQETPAPPVTARDLTLVLWRRLWLVVLIMAVSTATAVVLSRRTPKAWQATAQLLLVQRAPMMVASAQSLSSIPMVESVDTQITLLQSRSLAEKAAQRVKGISGDGLLGASSVAPQKEGDNVINVVVEADSRQHAQDRANALCDTFVAYKESVSKQSSQGTLATLQKQAGQARRQADAADVKLQRFERTHKLNGIDVLDAPAQRTAALNAVLSQSQVVAGLQNDYGTARTKADSLAGSLGSANSAIRTSQGVRDDSQVLKLQEDLQTLQRRRVETAQRYRPASRPIQALDAQIADTAARLKAAIQGTLDNNPSLQAQSALADASQQARFDAAAARSRLDQATRRLEQLRRETADLPQISQEADTLTRAATGAHNTSDLLDRAVQAAQLDQAAASGNVQIVQRAYAPEAPVRPSPKRDLLVGAGVGLCLSLLAVFLLEQTDRSVRTAADVRRLADGPVIAVLPQMTRVERGRLGRGDTPPEVLEAYNAARANLGLAFRQRGGVELDDHQVILVSSALPGEGKSLTASELAQSYARAGRKVVLVNADMRRASSVSLLQPGAEPGPGLAEVLSGGAEVRDALTQTDLPNLSVLHSGKAARNPIDLISQPRLADAMRSLRETADVVIVDSPPASVVADALLLAPHVDCILYVVGVGMVNNENVRHTAAALSSAAPKMLAYFINRIPHVLGEPRSYSYADYMYAPGAGVPADGSRVYTATRTMVLQQSPDPDRGAVVEATPAGVAANGVKPRSPLQVLPEIGSRLTTLDGPYLGQSFALSPTKPLVLGTLPDSDIVLARDATVSQVHARVAPVEGGYAVYDDSSTNGTFVNGALVSRHTLAVGDVLQLGASRFRYE